MNIINGINIGWLPLIAPLEIGDSKEFNEEDRQRIASCISNVIHKKYPNRYKITKVEKGVIKVTRVEDEIR